MIPLLSALSPFLPTSRRGRVTLVAIMVIGAALRLVSLDWGLPSELHHFPYHPDELTNVNAPRRMLESGNLNPHFFHYGSGYSYCVWLAYLASSALGWLTTPHDYFLIARVVVVAFALLTLPVLFALGREVDSERTGLVAAALLAATPAHVMHSSFATVDIPSVFFGVLSLWLAVRYLHTGHRARLFGAAFCCGLAAATKYPMGMVGLSALVALALVRGQRTSGVASDIAVGIGGAAGGFLLGCPYAILDFATFWSHMSYELFEHSVQGHQELFSATGNGWVFLLAHNLPYVLGPALLLLGGVGTATLVYRRPRAGFVLLAFAVPYFIVLGAVQIRFMRYAIALAPVACLGAAFLLARPATWAPAPRRLLTAVAALLIAAPAVMQSLAFTHPDARDDAVAFATIHIPHGADVGVLSHPSWYSAPLSRFNRGKPASAYGEPTEDRFALANYSGWDPQRLRREQPAWFVISEFWWSFENPLAGAGRRDTLATLARDYDLAWADAGFPVGWRWVFANTTPPHDWLYPFPEIRVYRLRPPSASPGR